MKIGAMIFRKRKGWLKNERRRNLVSFLLSFSSFSSRFVLLCLGVLSRTTTKKNCTEKLKRWTTVNETLRRPLCDGRRQKFERGRNRQNSSRDECPPVPFLSSPLSPVYRGRNKVNTTALFSIHAAFPDEGGGKKK